MPEPSRRSRSARRSVYLVTIAAIASVLMGCALDNSTVDREAEPVWPLVGSPPSEIPSDAPLTWNTYPEAGVPMVGERRELGTENSPGLFFEGRDVSTSAPTPVSVGKGTQRE